jgi:guanylate kinase
MKQGKVIIFSAPSGAGKTTIVRHLLSVFPNLTFSVSATTRNQRPNEIHGKDYYFISPTEFKEKLAQGEFLEYQQVYEDLFYGTLGSEVSRIHAEGKHAIFDVDVKGGINLKKAFGDKALSVFVKVKSVEVLAERLSFRNTETEAKKNERLAKAASELLYETQFDVVLINDNLENTFREAEQIVSNFLAK